MNRAWGILIVLLSILFPAFGGVVIYVDPAGSNSDVTNWQGAFEHLNDAIMMAVDGDEIRVAGGTYTPDMGTNTIRGDRSATFMLKTGVVIRGGYAGISNQSQTGPDARDIHIYASILSGDLDRNDSSAVPTSATDNSHHVVTGQGVDSTAMLDGFIITAGEAVAAVASPAGAGMHNISGSPTIMHCVFTNNSAEDLGGAMLNESNSNPTIVNCTFSGNWAANSGGGIHNSFDSRPNIINCIFWDNSTFTSGNDQSAQISGSTASISYSCIQGWSNDGIGNISQNPLFAEPAHGDFHLRSQSGRFVKFGDSNAGQPTELWVLEEQSSPCINAGDPMMDFDPEPMPNGFRINMGAYGGTPQASLGRWKMSSDINTDLVVEETDLALIAADWLRALPWARVDPPQPPAVNPTTYHVDVVREAFSGDGLTRETAFGQIQEGVDAAANGDIVLVWPGIYNLDYPLNFMGKAITVKSADKPAILTNQYGIGVEFSFGEGPNSVLANFIITGCDAGIYIIGDMSYSCSPTITNVTVAGNSLGVYAFGQGSANINNCIIWDNVQFNLSCVDNQSRVEYSCVEGGIEAGYNGDGNIYTDPMFANPGEADYHLLSKYGRFFPNFFGQYYLQNLWVMDTMNSACIDAGNPYMNPMRERDTGGGRVNMGAYGNTQYAGRSQWIITGDVNRDGRVDLADFAALAENWQRVAPWVK